MRRTVASSGAHRPHPSLREHPPRSLNHTPTHLHSHPPWWTTLRAGTGSHWDPDELDDQSKEEVAHNTRSNDPQTRLRRKDRSRRTPETRARKPEHKARRPRGPEPKNQEEVPAGKRHRGNVEYTGEGKGAQKGHAASIPRAKARNQNTSQTRASATTAYQEETDVPANDVELQVILLDLRAAHLHWEAGRSSSHASPEEEF